MSEPSPDELTVDRIASDRSLFNSFVYTPWEEAIEECKRRENDPVLAAYVERTVRAGIPPIMNGKKSMVLFRHVLTPNYEVHRFLVAADAFPEFQPLVLEYTKDKYTNRNDWKFSLGKMSFHKGHTRTNETIVENKTIIDMNDSNFKPIDSIRTHWGQNLVEFHHELFDTAYPNFKNLRFDLSDWIHEAGPSPKEYYKSFIALFLRNGILFENFLVDSKEYNFTKEIILPAFLELYAESGHKPLIVALEPTDIEGDRFWHSHPFVRKDAVDAKERGTPSA